MNPSKIIKYQLYLLQLENYELGRYWKLLFTKGLWPKSGQRKDLVWTLKAKGLMIMAVALHALIVVFISLVMTGSRLGVGILIAVIIIAALVFLPFYFILFSLSLLLIKPLDSLVKYRLVARAKSKINNLKSKITIIGIAGSYGKTTMKEVLKQILGIRYKVIATPDSVNTPVGIARWILKELNEETRVLIIEMGEHYKGDVKEICDIAKPDIAVVTGVNEAHLERMKTLENITATIFEVVSCSKEKALVLLNGDDKNVAGHYKEYVWPDHRIERFEISDFRLKSFSPEKLRWEGEIGDLGKIEINLLGEYGLGDVDAVIKIAKGLGMSGQEIKMGLMNVKPVEHRLQPIKAANNVLIIDDSYNGNPEGAAEAIKVLSRFKDRRKIYLTPGLVEMGKSSEKVHREIGRQLAGVADVVILVENSVTTFVEQGIREQALGNSDGKPKIIWFNTAPEAHENLKNILNPNDVIVFQNDWGDQYL